MIAAFCIFSLLFLVGCDSQSRIISEINVGLYKNNELRIRIDVLTTDAARVYAEYWRTGADNKKFISDTSAAAIRHMLVLCNIAPHTDYAYQLVTEQNGTTAKSKVYTFQSHSLPMWLKDQFKDTAANPAGLPEVFRTGLMLMNKRETPGILYMTDYRGNMRWYHMIDGTGFKVAHFTKEKTIISILGKNDEPTSYGSEILEIDLLGDTLLHLKKGQGDFRQTIHHEVLRRGRNEIVTLYVEDRVMDLRSAGGKERDTVKGDGILIMDTLGRQLWKWSAIDAQDPRKDPGILKTKGDWLHANSLSYDKDNNFIISFYNNGQIWKIDAKTGAIIWKLGRGGSFAIPPDLAFSEVHAAHINRSGSLLFFDNGVEKKQSAVFAFKLDEAAKTVIPDFHFNLPREVYNERMGSAYMVDDSTILSCCSKRHITVLTNRSGTLLWTLDTAIPPYRVEFLTKQDVAPILQTD